MKNTRSNAAPLFVIAASAVIVILASLTALVTFCRAQQPQVAQPNPQALQGINGKWTNGIAPGYYPTCSPATCSATLMLSVGPGTCFDSSGTRHTYAGGTLTMTGSSTNYVYLATSNCSLTQSTTGYPTTGIMPVATVTATTTITGIVDDRTWFGGAGGSGGGGGGSAIKECIVTTGDPGAASPVLADDNDSPAQCGNDFGADIVITAVACWANSGSPTITPILTGGSSTSVLTGALTCGTAAWAAGTVNGTPTIHTFSSNGATCASTPCTLDSNITTAGGVAKYIVVKYTGTTTGGSTTPLALGTCANHQPCYNNAGTLGGIAPGVGGTVMTSQGTSSTPSFVGCLLSNGVVAKTASYTFDTAGSDRGSLVTFNGSSLTATLPNPPTDATWCVNVINLNSSNLTISRNGLSINTGSSNLTLLQYQSATVWTDGSNYFATIPISGVTTTSSSQSPVGGTPPTSAHIIGTNGSANFVAATAHDVAVPLTCSDTSGSGTAQTCTTSPSFTPATNDCVNYTTTTTNSGTGLTVNVNSLGAKSIAVPGGSGYTTTLTASTVPTGKVVPLCYDGTNWNATAGLGVSSSGGGGGSAGPTIGALYCTSSTFSCAARFNVVANKLILAFCVYFTNGAGAGTPGFNDTAGLNLTWTQVATVFQAGQSRGVTVWWANPGASTGADTFNCTNTVTMSFGDIDVVMVNDATLAGPIDGTPITQTGNNAAYDIAITTASDGELIFMAAEYGGGFTAFGGGTANTFVPPFWQPVFIDGSSASQVLAREAKKAGTYYLQGSFSANHAFQLFAVK